MNEMNIEKVADYICSLSLIEASELAKTLEEKLGIDISSLSFGSSKQESVNSTPEQTEFSVCLCGFDSQKKISIIKVIREITGLGLKESKDFVEKEEAKKLIKDKCSKEDVEKLKKKLVDCGAEVIIE